MKTSTKVKILGMAIGTMLLTSVTAHAAPYTAYVLPAFSGNNYTNAHTKQTTAGYITNKVDAMSNVSGGEANFWACNGSKTQVSGDYKQSVGSIANIYHSLKVGQSVIMGMENAKWQDDRGFVSGDVNFR